MFSLISDAFLCLGLAGVNLKMTPPTALLRTGKPMGPMETVRHIRGTPLGFKYLSLSQCGYQSS